MQGGVNGQGMRSRALFRRHNAVTRQRGLPAHGPAPHVRLLAWSVFACALLLCGLAVALQFAAPDRRALIQAGLLWALTALAWRFPVQFGPKSRIYTTSAATFAGALLLPPWLAMAVAALGIAAGECLASGTAGAAAVQHRRAFAQRSRRGGHRR